jgi:hypothetical protein
MHPHPEKDALVVGMTLVPGLLPRNRAFALYESPEVRQAKRRSGVLRGIVWQLAKAQGDVEGLVVDRRGSGCELRYRVPGLRIERRAVLTELELACVRYLAGRAGVAGFSASEEDRAGIERALRRLASGLRLDEVEAGAE